MHPVDGKIIAQDFPILATQMNGKPLVFLDSAASAQKPYAVMKAMTHMMSHSYANVHRGLYTLANDATQIYEGARQAVHSFLNAPKDFDVVFTRSATGALNLVANALGQNHIGEGDEIILSIMEHHSNIVPWHYLRERKGAVIKWVGVDNTGALDMEALQNAFSSRTKVVSVAHMSNVLGTVNDIAAISMLCKKHGVPLVVDGSQGVVHLGANLATLGADFYVFTGHKLYGPTGIGVLCASHEWLNALPPFEGGGEMIEAVSQESVTYAQSPSRFEAGTPPIVEAAGLHAAIDYIRQFDRYEMIAHENALRDYAFEKLSEFKGLRILGTTPNKGAIHSFTFGDIHAHDVAMLLDKNGVCVRAGTHCAQPLLKHYGVSSSCRASFAIYNSKDDVDALCEALKRVETLFA